MFEKPFGYFKIILVILLLFSIGFVLMQFVFSEHAVSNDQNYTSDELIFAHTVSIIGINIFTPIGSIFNSKFSDLSTW